MPESKYLEKLIEIAGNIREFYLIERELGDASPSDALVGVVGEKHIDLLKFLMNNGLFRANLFPLLVSANSELALEYLCDRFVGKNVNYDGGMTGFTGSLKGFFYDIVELRGSQYLFDFLHSDDFDQKKLRDHRVKDAIFFAIPELDSIKDVDAWLISGVKPS